MDANTIIIYLQILNTIEAYKVVIIKGATGCGKTTQIPQFILDEAKEKRKFCNIVVTQPRRLAAISVAKRVCKERGWEIGSVVGYQVIEIYLYGSSKNFIQCIFHITILNLMKRFF